MRGAVRYLAQKYSKKISVSTGRRWLTNPVYRGDTAYHNDEVVSNTHLPIGMIIPVSSAMGMKLSGGERARLALHVGAQ